MDLLFKRYASPFLVLDEMILNNRFKEYVEELCEITKEEKENEDDKLLWDFWLHNVEGMTFSEFKNGDTKNVGEALDENEIQDAITIAAQTINGFNPGE